MAHLQAVEGAGHLLAGGDLTIALGENPFTLRIDRPDGPTAELAAEVLAEVDPATLPMPRARGRSVVSLARAAASGELVLDSGADRRAARELLLRQPGVGPWTADYVAMRAFADPDILLATDLAARRAAARLGLELADSRRWSPWRSYVTHHLWALAIAATHPTEEPTP